MEQGKAAPIKRAFVSMDEDDAIDNVDSSAPDPSSTAPPPTTTARHVRRGDHMRAPVSSDKDDTPSGSLLVPARPPVKKSGFSTDM